MDAGNHPILRRPQFFSSVFTAITKKFRVIKAMGVSVSIILTYVPAGYVLLDLLVVPVAAAVVLYLT